MGPGGEAASYNNVGISFLSICAALLPDDRSGRENLHNANAPYHSHGPIRVSKDGGRISDGSFTTIMTE